MALTELANHEGSWVVVHESTGQAIELSRDERFAAQYFDNRDGYTVYGYLEWLGMMQSKHDQERGSGN